MKIAIAGAGIAGLACATFLARAGHEVTLYDQFERPHPVGSGLMIQPVGLAVLKMLGLDRDLIERASPITRIYGETLSALPVLDVSYSDLRPALTGHAVQRSVLFDLLHAAALHSGATLVPDTKITGARDGSLESEHGAPGPFDLVVDALGAYSALCPKPSAPLKFGALWALLDWPAGGPFNADMLEQRYAFASKMAGVLPVGQTRPGDGQKLTFFWSLRARDHAAWRDCALDVWKDEVRTLWPATDAILDQITSHRDLTFTRYTHRTLMKPYADRLVHVGDSFHATSPQLGQGANMALLDAAALAIAVRDADPGRIGPAYAALRRRHVLLYQSASWLFTPMYQSDSRVLPWVRNRIGAPLAGLRPMRRVLASLVAGELGRPLQRIRDIYSVSHLP